MPANARRTGNPSPSKPDGAVRDLPHGARLVAQSGLAQAAQDGQVVDGDRGHGTHLLGLVGTDFNDS